MAEPTPCATHPSTPTRLRCSSCETPICPDCAREAAVGYKCPDCARQLDGTTTKRSHGGALPLSRPGSGDGRSTSLALATRATLVGLVAAAIGGAILAPVLRGGFLLLISSGAIGFAVARAAYWGGGDHDSPYLRAMAMTCAGVSVAIALAWAGLPAVPTGLTLLAYPAAVYGGWIVVRGR
ncbi:MAG: B-box zinc finger protein [Nitriliruptoraceae bacterium]